MKISHLGLVTIIIIVTTLLKLLNAKVKVHIHTNIIWPSFILKTQIKRRKSFTILKGKKTGLNSEVASAINKHWRPKTLDA